MQPVCTSRCPSPFAFLFFILQPPRSALFPYTTLFRSHARCGVSVYKHAPSPAGGLGARGIVSRAASPRPGTPAPGSDRKSTRLNSSHVAISYAVFCLKKKNYREQLIHSVSLEIVARLN